MPVRNFAFVSLALLIAGCSGGSSTLTPTATRTASPPPSTTSPSSPGASPAASPSATPSTAAKASSSPSASPTGSSSPSQSPSPSPTPSPSQPAAPTPTPTPTMTPNVSASDMVFVADNKDGALLGFSTTANGNATPTAVIAGSNTTISAQNQNGIPFSALLAFDGIGDLYTGPFEAADAAIFPTGASGNVAPSSTLTAPDYIDGIAFDSAGDAYVAGPSSSTPSAPPQIDIFAKGAMGTAMPLATISGSATELNDPRAMAIDASGNLYVINYPPAAAAVQILIFSSPITSNGNIAPSAIISGNQTQLEYPNGLAFDSKGNLLVSDSKGAVLIFGKGSTGNATSTSISGSDTDLGEPSGVAVDASDNIWVSDAGTEYIPAILEFAAGSSGNTIALKHIYGAATMINKPYQIVYVRGGTVTTAASRKHSSREGAPQRRP